LKILKSEEERSEGGFLKGEKAKEEKPAKK